MTTKLSINNLTAETLAWISGPRITSVQITDGNYNVIDDTAANASSIGYILINGNDFDLNPQVLIDTLPVTSLIRVSNSLIRAQIPPSAAASYNIQVINSDGSTAILVNGLTYSTFPAWITGSSLTSIEAIAPINIQLSANEAQNSAITYALAASNTLPAGATLYSNGYIQGRVTANANATYNFTVVATDAQNQDTGRAFSLSTTLNTPPAWLGQPDTLPISQPLNLYSNTIVAVDPALASYIVTSGSLPPGLTLDVGTGVIAGQTSVANSGNTYSFVVTATDTAGLSATKTMSITVGSIGFNSVTLSLKTRDINTANNHAFIDSSANNYQIVRGGSVTQGTFSPFSHTGWSMYFGGNGNYISTSAGNVVFNPGATGTWTLEGWIYPITSGAFYGVGGGGSYDNSIACYWSSSTNKFSFLQGNGGSNPVNIVSSTTHPAGSWYYFTVCKDSNNFIRMFINGVMVGWKSYSSSISSGNRPVINGVNDGNGLGNDGGTYHISNLRWVKGGALYASNTGFTPPTQPLTTSVSSGTCWMLMGHRNNFIDGAFDIVGLDWSTSAGTPSIQAFSPFAPSIVYSNTIVGGSGYFSTSTSDYLGLPNGSVAVGSNDFSIEAWIYPIDRSAAYSFFGGNTDRTTAGGSSITLSLTNSNGYFEATHWFGGSATNLYSPAIPLNAWTHLATCRTGETLGMFVNGVRVSSTSCSGSINAGSATFNPSIGSNGTGTADNFKGYISNFKMVIGSGGYDATASTITVPTAPLTATLNTRVLAKFDNASIFDTTSKNNFQTGTNAQVSTSRAKYNNSSIAITPTSSASASTRAITPRQPNPGYIFGTGDFTVEMWVYLNGYGTNTRLYDGRPGANGAYLAIQVNTGGFSGTTNALQIYVASAVRIDAGTAAPLDQWFHLAVCRASGSTKMFVNGTQVGSTYADTNDYAGGSATQPVPVIGSSEDGNNAMNGNIDGVRIIKRALYTDNFTPPTAAFGLI